MTLPADIGIASQVYGVLPLGAALELLAAHTGLVEIDSFGMHTVLSPLNRRQAAASGLRFTVHGPSGSGLQPASPDETVRRQTVDTHRRHAAAAAELGALVYVAHPDYAEPPGPRDPAAVAALQRTIADLAALQRELRLPIALENMPVVGTSQFAAPGDLDLGELGLALDGGHAAICGSLDDFLTEPRARLRHVHLHSNGGRAAADVHGPLGQGMVDAAQVLRIARAAGATVILEHGDEAAALASIAWLRAAGLA